MPSFEKFAKLASERKKLREKQRESEKIGAEMKAKREKWEENLPERTRRVRAAQKKRGYKDGGIAYRDGGVCKKTEAKKAALRKLMGK